VGSAKRDSALTDRAQQIFKTLVEFYIETGQPVGSRTLSRGTSLTLSPATVRNVMADLEEAGLLRSPHTSAGRVPTVSGYRLFVDSLLTVAPLQQQQIDRVKDQLDPVQNADRLAESASSLLSEVTRLAGVVMLPRQDHTTLRQVEFVPLSDNQVLVIMIINGSEVQNRIIHTDRKYSPAELQQAANYINAIGSGDELADVRQRLLDELNVARETMNHRMMVAIEMAQKAFPAVSEHDDDFVVAGQTNLMGYGELSDMERLRELFEAFRSKRDILYLLDQCLGADGVQIFIGEESGYNVLDECSVVTAPYEQDGEVIGVLGVIGPTRMAYDRVIPIVDMTARLLGAALNQRH